MRFVFLVLLTAILTYFALMTMPWWIPMLISFVLILVFPVRSWQAFLATGIGAAVCYFFIAFRTDQANEHLLSRKMADLFQLPSYSFMIIITVVTGFITAGLGGWTGAKLYRLLKPGNKTRALADTGHN